MNVTIDGDSVAEPRPDNWPVLLADRKGWYVVNLSEHRSTTRHVLDRLNKVYMYLPELYLLQVGQWSSHHEDIVAFTHNLAEIIEKLHSWGVRVCLVTPASLDPYTAWTAAVVRKAARTYNTMLVDRSWFIDTIDQIPCHLNEKGSLVVTQFFFDWLSNPYKGGL